MRNAKWFVGVELGLGYSVFTMNKRDDNKAVAYGYYSYNGPYHCYDCACAARDYSTVNNPRQAFERQHAL